MSLHTRMARLGALALAVVVTAPTVFGHGRAWWNVEYDEQVIVFPDTERHVSVVADLHTHTVFSDGHVWAERPRGRSAPRRPRRGRDHRPPRVPAPSRVRANPGPQRARVAEARMAAAGTDLIVIAGSEITRDAPAGHMNAVFVEDATRCGPSATGPEPNWRAFGASAGGGRRRGGERPGRLRVLEPPLGSPRTSDYRTELTELHETLIDGVSCTA